MDIVSKRPGAEMDHVFADPISDDEEKKHARGDSVSVKHHEKLHDGATTFSPDHTSSDGDVQDESRVRPRRDTIVSRSNDPVYHSCAFLPNISLAKHFGILITH